MVAFLFAGLTASVYIFAAVSVLMRMFFAVTFPILFLPSDISYLGNIRIKI